MAEEIVMDIDANGNVQIETNGFVGADCQAITKGLEEALGTVERAELKPEYRQAKPATKAIGT